MAKDTAARTERDCTRCAPSRPWETLARAFARARAQWVAFGAAAGLILLLIPSGALALVTTGHQFAVSESGAATITIPIQVPRGIAGMEPQLSLNYSSGSGNGLLGVGWTLSGPSAITRCPKNPKVVPTDQVRGAVTFATSDRYCLDGQRLVTVDPAKNTDALYGADATEYRTERDSFSQIKAVGAMAPSVPWSIEVRTKAGLLLQFGLTAASRVMTNRVVSSGPNTINRWMLQRISDRHGNYVEFIYCGGEVRADGSCTDADVNGGWLGSKVLHYVQYTNRATFGSLDGMFGVVFRYERRPDQIEGFHAGSSSRQTQRMTKIETYRDFVSASNPGKLVRSYTIGYEAIEENGQSVRATNASRITSVQERDGSGTPLPPLTFAVAPDSVFGMTSAHQPSAPAGPPKPPPECGGVVLNRVFKMCR